MSTMTSSSRVRTFATAIFGVLASSLAAVCMAADSIDTPTVTVKFADLNVSSPQGAEELYKRIVAAADQVCKDADIDSNLNESQTQRLACVDDAIAGAVKHLDQPRLVAIYNAKHRQPLPISVAGTR
jgi:UrcA family protein